MPAVAKPVQIHPPVNKPVFHNLTQMLDIYKRHAMQLIHSSPLHNCLNVRHEAIM